jgi:hypothetical protein
MPPKLYGIEWMVSDLVNQADCLFGPLSSNGSLTSYQWEGYGTWPYEIPDIPLKK